MVPQNISPWEINESEFPLAGSPAEKLQFLIRYAVLAPSGRNTQPWRFEVHDDVVDLYREADRSLPVADPMHRELIMSCGAALLNLRVAIQHFGYCSEIELFPDRKKPLLLARTRLAGSLHWKPEDSLFDAIPRRHSNRTQFDEQDISQRIINRLEAAAAFEGA